MDEFLEKQIDGVGYMIQHMENGLDMRTALARLRDILDEQEKKVAKKKKRELISLLLCKTSFSNANFFYCFEPTDQKEKEHFRSFAALGSMADCIQLHMLGQPKDILDAVFKENDRVSACLDGSVFVNPRYLVYSYEDDSPEQRHYDDFWKSATMPDNFFFVTNINVSDPVTTYAQRLGFRKKLYDAIREQQWQFDGIFDFIVYDSLDLLTDFTVLWRSKNIRPVLQALQDIVVEGLIPELGRNQTICSVPVDRLLDHPEKLGGADFAEEETALERLKESIGPRSNTIDNMTLHAMGGDYGRLMELREALKRHKPEEMTIEECFVLGSSDYIFFIQNATDRNICTYLREIIRSQAAGAPISPMRVETNIGIKLREPSRMGRGEPECGNTKKLKAATEWLLENIKRTLLDKDNAGLFTADRAPWVSSVLELCNMLVQMNRSCIYDNASFLLLDSMYFFHAWLMKEILKPDELKHAPGRLTGDMEYIQKYVNGWILLVDLITRSGGTTAYMPGYSPLQYHISSSVVEITQAFFVKVARFLRKCAWEAEDVSCILVPTQCLSISTEVLLHQIFTIENSKGAVICRQTKALDDSQLVYIEVPMELLSRPRDIATVITHEAGHHYGQAEITCRAKRHDKFAEMLGQVLSDLLYSSIDENKRPSIELKIPQPELEGRNGQHLRVWEHYLPKCMEETKKKLREIEEDAVSEVKEQIRVLFGIEGDMPLEKYIHELRDLFCESVCDTLMLTLLHEGPARNAKQLAAYIRSVFLSEADLARCPGDPKKPSDNNLRFSSIVMRIYVVWQVMKQVASVKPRGKEKDKFTGIECTLTDHVGVSAGSIMKELKAKDGQPTIEGFLVALAKGLSYLDAGKEEPDDDMSGYHSTVALKTLIEYLMICRKSIEEMIRGCAVKRDEDTNNEDNYRRKPDRDKLERDLADIRRYYQAFMKNDFLGRPFYEMIYEYRREMIEQIDENSGICKRPFFSRV